MRKKIFLDIHVIPRAKQSEIVRQDRNCWRVRISAKPIEGAANDALIELVAKNFGVAKSCVAITHGRRSRNKRVEIFLS